MGRLEDINDERTTLWNRGICYGVENYLSEISETLAMMYDKMNEKKTAMDKEVCRGSVHADDMGRYDPYTDSFVRGDKAE